MKFAYKTVGDKTQGSKKYLGNLIDLKVNDFIEILVGFRRIDSIEQAQNSFECLPFVSATTNLTN